MESGNIDDALYCYDQMHSDSIAPDELTFVCCLRTCGNAGSLTRGEDIYSDVLLKGLECDDFVGNTVIDMYSKCGLLEEAEFLLNKLSLQILYSWNGIVTGYSQRGESQKVFLMFKRMLAAEINPNTITFVSILNVCNHTGELSNGYIYYVAMGRYFEIIPVLQHITFIVDLLGRSGMEIIDGKVLNRLCERTTASWNALIARHMESGNIDDALYCYDQMHSDSIAPDELTFVCCLRTCGNARSLTRGEDIYSDVLLKGLECDDFVGNTVIDMYSKCGLLEEAEFLLNKLSLQILYSWNGIVTGYSQRGESQKVFLMFKRMLAAEINPNTITFVSILNVCNHTGCQKG
ncbi:hypothetical protein KP509_28G054700 [Ceratopteris richardii]|uniref:Pentatricopeptide repeat-containing protein n=1 Tax=Ceratopteris richardii TaxID=49495 RepID=A0A8T2REL3_CERRI|nr:hypothetical protein KP509_28G054700 [Ceratopteris richardii]